MRLAFNLISNSGYLFMSKIQMNVVLYTFLGSIYTSVCKSIHLQIQCYSSCFKLKENAKISKGILFKYVKPYRINYQS